MARAGSESYLSIPPTDYCVILDTVCSVIYNTSLKVILNLWSIILYNFYDFIAITTRGNSRHGANHCGAFDSPPSSPS